jgi:hypothetical protein
MESYRGHVTRTMSRDDHERKIRAKKQGNIPLLIGPLYYETNCCRGANDFPL